MTKKNAEFVTNRPFPVIPGWERPDKTGSDQNRWHIQAYSTLYRARICDPLRNFPEPSIVQKFPGRGWTSFPPRTLRNSQQRAKPSDMPSASKEDTRTPLLAVPKRRSRRSFFARLRSAREEKILVEIFSKRVVIYLFSKLNINFTRISLRWSRNHWDERSH